jgi:hypothetical protein
LEKGAVEILFEKGFAGGWIERKRREDFQLAGRLLLYVIENIVQQEVWLAEAERGAEAQSAGDLLQQEIYGAFVVANDHRVKPVTGALPWQESLVDLGYLPLSA